MEKDDKQEILSAIAEISKEVKILSNKVDTNHEEAMDAIHMLSSSTDERFNAVDHQISGIRNEMVTKDYLDRRFANQEMETMNRVETSLVRR